MKRIYCIVILALGMLFLASCADKKPSTGDNGNGITFEDNIPGFGDRAYLVDVGTRKYISNQGVFELNGGMLSYTDVGTEKNRSSVVLCSDLSCRHIHSDDKLGIPVTCEAEAPYGSGYPIYHDGYVYVIGETSYTSEYGLYVHRRALDGGGWEEIAFVPGYLLSNAEMVNYHFVEGNNVYLSVVQINEYEMAFGTLQNSCMGVMELDFSTGEYRMIVPTQKDLYQNAYYMNLINQDVFVYCYVSAPYALLKDLYDADFQQVADAFIENSTTKVCVIDMQTLEMKEIGAYGQLAMDWAESSEPRSYFVDVFREGVVYVEENVLYLKEYGDGEVHEIDTISQSKYADAIRFSNALRVTLSSEDNVVASAIDVLADGSVYEGTDTSKLGRCYMCFDNGFSLYQIIGSSDFGDDVCLMEDEPIRNGEVPGVVYYRFSN